MFIDKPLAASLEDVYRIVQLSRQSRTPFFGASSVRFHPEIPRLRGYPGVGKVTRVRASYLLNQIPFHPDLFYYGIHGVEALYAVMGRGCLTLSRKMEGDFDVTTCRWKDGRIGVYYGMPKGNAAQPLLTVTGTDGATSISGSGGNEGIVQAIAQFLHTGRSPVDMAETVELLVPFVQSAEEAARAVAATRYPPQGIRGVATVHRANRYGRVTDYFARANDEMCVLAQLETRAAVDGLEAIAAVDGVDAVFIGPSDLAASLGHAGHNAHPEVRETIEAACRRAQAVKIPIGILAPLEADARAYLDMGFAFVAVGSDIVVLRKGCDALVRMFKR